MVDSDSRIFFSLITANAKVKYIILFNFSYKFFDIPCYIKKIYAYFLRYFALLNLKRKQEFLKLNFLISLFYASVP